MLGSSTSPIRNSRASRPICAGSGFIALDQIYRENSDSPLGQYAGGSCGNVMAILSFLGWKALPVARLGNSSDAESLISDLASFRVSTKYLFREVHGVTPVIIQRLRNHPDGTPYHKFEWRSPVDGSRLPSYRPMPQRMAAETSEKLPNCRVFYFDRADRSSLILASKMHEKGALVFFEPSSIKDPGLFAECLSVSHIVKYSADRISGLPASTSNFRPILEIQTLGEDGLRYRLKQANTRIGSWMNKRAIPTAQFKDACGSGDWCSAGILSVLCSKHVDNAQEVPFDFDKVNEAISYGQSLASINCEYEGARGAMYAHARSPSKLVKLAETRAIS